MKNLKYVLLSSVTDVDQVVCGEISSKVTPSTTVVYIRGKSSPSPKYFKNVCSFYNNLGIWKIVYFDLEQANSEQLLEAIEDSDILHLGGGNTFEFGSKIIEGDYYDKFKAAIPKVDLVVAESAGGILLSNDIEVARFIDEKKSYIESRSLNLFNFTVIPHYNTLSSELLAQVIEYRETNKLSIYGILDGGGLMVYEGGLKRLVDVVTI